MTLLVFPMPANALSAAQISTLRSGSVPTVGSSRISSSGEWIIEQARDNLLCWPPLRFVIWASSWKTSNLHLHSVVFIYLAGKFEKSKNPFDPCVNIWWVDTSKDCIIPENLLTGEIGMKWQRLRHTTNTFTRNIMPTWYPNIAFVRFQKSKSNLQVILVINWENYWNVYL